MSHKNALYIPAISITRIRIRNFRFKKNEKPSFLASRRFTYVYYDSFLMTNSGLNKNSF